MAVCYSLVIRRRSRIAIVRMGMDYSYGCGVPFERKLSDLVRTSLRAGHIGAVGFTENQHDSFAEVLGKSHATIEREWSFARSWLRSEMSNEATGVSK